MKTLTILCTLTALCLATSCSRFLDEKSDSSLATPETLTDNQALLDRYGVLGSNAVSGEISSTDFYVTDTEFNSMPYEPEKRLYTWQPDHVALSTGNDWESCFSRINVFNTVLHNLSHYDIANAENVKGQALVLRASVYLEAAQIWCPVYDARTAPGELGLPLRLDPDVNVPSVRATLEDTYKQILRDLRMACDLLPVRQIAFSRPSKVTALAYLSRAFLYMGDYENAQKYGAQALSLYDKLIDFNELNAAASYPIALDNAEVLLPTSMGYSPFLAGSKAKVNKEMYGSYAPNDLRKSIFFKVLPTGDVLFKGNYSGSSGRMTCMATDEVYLTVAESYAFLNRISEAMDTLNKLLIKRWKTGTFIPFTATTKEEALWLVREERRKELLFRGLRWPDLKRYNREGAGITISRTINGQQFTLPPNDPRYAIAIPEDIIKMTGMPQNPR